MNNGIILNLFVCVHGSSEKHLEFEICRKFRTTGDLSWIKTIRLMWILRLDEAKITLLKIYEEITKIYGIFTAYGHIIQTDHTSNREKKLKAAFAIFGALIYELTVLIFYYYFYLFSFSNTRNLLFQKNTLRVLCEKKNLWNYY